jgi:type 1 fimbria pilin
VTEMVEGFGLNLSPESQTASAESTPAELHIAVRTYPNPFNPETQISYTLASSQNVQIQIYNVSGQLIRTYDQGYQPAGTYSVRWDGRNQGGDMTASGVYLCRIQAGPYQVTDRMVLLK